jgi:hypothetical protein
MTVTVSALAERSLRRLGVAIVPPGERPPLSVTIPAATLATGALIELGVIASDETPPATDQALALSKVSAVHDALVAQAFVPWAVGGVPQAVAEEYIKLTALIMATSFGKTMGDAQVHALLEARIKRVATIMRAPEIAEAAVMAVHNDLVMRGRARWSSQDIPDSLAQPYVMLAAAACAREFDAKTDPLELQIAERMISQYIALPTSGERIAVEYF